MQHVNAYTSFKKNPINIIIHVHVNKNCVKFLIRKNCYQEDNLHVCIARTYSHARYSVTFLIKILCNPKFSAILTFVPLG